MQESQKPTQTPNRLLRLPDLDFAKSAVLNTRRSSESKRMKPPIRAW